jgi:cysteine-rich repeat protein
MRTGVVGLLALALVACGDDDGGGNQNQDNGNLNLNHHAWPRCGDGVVQPPEACDDATANSATVPDACRPDCTLPACGDGVVDPGPVTAEQCDPPAPGRCDASCREVEARPCDAPGTYDATCVDDPGGQWCHDDGAGGDPFCGCDPAFGDLDCRVEGFDRCDPVTHQCEPAPPCGEDDGEPNDDEPGATPLALDAAVAGALCAYDVDWLALDTGPEDTALTVTLTWTGAADLDLRLTDCSGAVLATAEARDAGTESLRARWLAASTRHCLEVSWYLGSAAAASYQVVATGRRACATDADCTVDAWCPSQGSEASLCLAGTPPGAGCGGDDVPGEDDSTSRATALVSGVGVLGRATCDGTGPMPLDMDLYVFDVGDRDRVTLQFQPGPGVQPDQIVAAIYDAHTVAWGATGGGVLDASGFVGGRYYLFVYPNPFDGVTFPVPVTYDATVTVSPSPGCAVRDHCGGLLGHGECAEGFCVPFEGHGAQGPLEYCDDDADCDPATTGSIWFGEGCLVGSNPETAADSFCLTDCTEDADCQIYSPDVSCVHVNAASPIGLCYPR